MNIQPGYESLASVLQRALDQAQNGKGAERHANQLPFDQQPMQTIAKRRGVGFLLGQADKKSEEAMGLPPGRDVAELLGAINYLAGAIIFLEGQREPVPANDNTALAPLERATFTCSLPGCEGMAGCPDGPCADAGKCRHG